MKTVQKDMFSTLIGKFGAETIKLLNHGRAYKTELKNSFGQMYFSSY